MAGLYVRNSAGIDAVLHMPGLKTAVHDLTEAVAESTRGAVGSVDGAEQAGVEVVVDDYVTDRVASSVTVTTSLGRWLQAQHGVLTIGAGQNGLEIKQKGGRR